MIKKFNTWLCLSLELQNADHFDDQAFSDKGKMLADLRLHIERLLLFVLSTGILRSWWKKKISVRQEIQIIFSS